MKRNSLKTIVSALIISMVTISGCGATGGMSVSDNSASANAASVSQAQIKTYSPSELLDDITYYNNVSANSLSFEAIDNALSPSNRYFLDKYAPVVSLNQIYISSGNTCELNDFINTIEDDTPVTYAYVTEPDFSVFGNQDVQIVFTDSNNNSISANTTLTILPVAEELTMELSVSHNAPEASDFLLDDGYTISFASPLPAAEDLTIGTYYVSLKVAGITTTSKLTFVDTTSPSANAVDVRTRYGAEFTADQLVTDVVDATNVTIEYNREPDWSLEGSQTLDIVLTDEAGNTFHVYPVVELVIDTSAPLIQANAVNVIVGNTLSYMNCIQVTDNLDKSSDIILSIDASAVDLKTVGTYEVYITATDLSGNTSTGTLVINVIEQPVVVVPVITQDMVNQKALEILGTIINDSMTTEQKVYAIWKWARYNIGYTHDFAIDNYYSAAYRAMTNKRSNCYGYASVIKIMCDLIGVPNFVVCDPQRPHYWNVIDCGDGYYHWDATPRIDGTIIYKWSDATLANYSSTHGGTHKFDRSQYPTIN